MQFNVIYSATIILLYWRFPTKKFYIFYISYSFHHPNNEAYH